MGLGNRPVSPSPRGSTPTLPGIPGILLSPPNLLYPPSLSCLAVKDRSRLTTSRCDKPRGHEGEGARELRRATVDTHTARGSHLRPAAMLLAKDQYLTFCLLPFPQSQFLNVS